MNNKILSVIDERDLHCVLNKFCSENLDIRTKTIYHERSIKNKGKSEWLHPDMVGFQLTTSNWDNNIIEVCKNFYISKAILYSFELKKSINIDTLREYYFQAVSNSSWANEGYLVTASLDEDNFELISEIKRLVGAFGIGIIKLDVINPKNSTIIFPAKRKDIVDGETMNKLYTINPDYQSYIQVVAKSLQINQVITVEWDSLKDYDKLYDKIKNMIEIEKKPIVKEKGISKEVLIKTETAIDVDDNLEDSLKKVTLDTKNVELTYTKPIKCTVNDAEYKGDSWTDLVVNIVTGLSKYDNKHLEKYIEKSRMLYNESKADYYRYNNDLKLYINGLSANSLYKEMQLLLYTFNVNLNKCTLYYKDMNKKK